MHKIKAGSLKRLLVHHEGINTRSDTLGSVRRPAPRQPSWKCRFCSKLRGTQRSPSRKDTAWPPAEFCSRQPQHLCDSALVWPRKERGLSRPQHGARGQHHGHGGAHSQRLGGTQHKVSFGPLQIIFAKGTFPGHPTGHHPKSLTKHWPCAQSYPLQHSM